MSTTIPSEPEGTWTIDSFTSSRRICCSVMDVGTSVGGIFESEEVDGEVEGGGDADEEVDLEEERGTMAPAAIAAASIFILELPNVLTVLR